MVEKIEYKRARKSETDTSKWSAWNSRCEQFRVSKCESKIGDFTRYYAFRQSPTGFRMLVHMKTYRTRRAAENALKKWVKLGSRLSRNERQVLKLSKQLSRRQPSRKRVA